MDIVESLRYVGSVARTKTLLQRGITKRALAGSLDSGLILRPQRGVFALPDAVPEFRAAVLHNGLATCASAAGHYGLWLLYPPKEHHVSCPDGSSGGHIKHELRTVPAHHTLPMVGMIDVLLHALRCLPELEAVVMVEGVVRRGEAVKPLLLEGYLVLRYCYEDIMFDRGRVLAEIQQALAGRVIR